MPLNNINPKHGLPALFLLLGLGAAISAAAKQSDTGLPLQAVTGRTTTSVPAYLDAPDPALKNIYDLNADSDAPRDLRLYGELLLQEGNDEGYSYVARAARKGDARAAYLVAESMAYGLWGQEQDYTLAQKWLHTSMSGNYAPAYELMAALSWDGDWDCMRNTHDAIWYLDQAIAGYGSGTPADAAQKKQLADYTRSLRTLRAAMNKLKDRNWDAVGRNAPQLKGIQPSFLQMRLSTFPDVTDDGLRHRLTYIQAAMEQRRNKYKLGKLGAVRLEYTGIQATGSTGAGNTALTSWNTTDTHFSASTRFYTPAFPSLPDAKDTESDILCKEAFRLAYVNDALAHELAHIYFCSRYPKLAEHSTGDARMTYEGHATNVAYEFTNTTFFHGKLSPERYADLFLEDEYKEYFFWFRENCLSPAGMVYWEILDRWERNSGEAGGRAHTRKQDTSGTPAAPPLQLFGKAFQGYM